MQDANKQQTPVASICGLGNLLQGVHVTVLTRSVFKMLAEFIYDDQQAGVPRLLRDLYEAIS
jgi:hypothetical protein